jgi:hypothetical protein
VTSPDPGWYDDPEDPNAQRYWDGQEWTPHRQRKATSAAAGQTATQTPQQPSAPPLPPPPALGGPTPQSQLQANVDKGRRIWSGLSGRQKIIVSIAAVFVAVAAIMVPVFAFGHGAGQSPSASGRAGSKGGSQYYQWGYQSATSGAARESYIDLSCTGFYGCSDPGPDTVKQACDGGWVGDANVPAEVKVADPDTGAYQAKKDDFVKGCSDAFRDHPPSPTATTRPRR